MRDWRGRTLGILGLLIALAVAACGSSANRLDSLPRPVSLRDVLMWCTLLGVDPRSVDWPSVDATLQAYANDLALPRTRALESVARSLADAKPAPGTDFAKWNLSDDDALRRAAGVAGSWFGTLRARDDALFGALGGVAGIGTQHADSMRQLRALDRARMACALPSGDMGPPDAVADMLHCMQAAGPVDPEVAQAVVQEHAPAILARLESLRTLTLESPWREAAASRDAFLAEDARPDDAEDDPNDPGARDRRTGNAIARATGDAATPLRRARVDQLLGTEGLLAALMSGSGPAADAARCTLVRYAMSSEWSRPDRNLRIARFLVLRDPDLDAPTRSRAIEALDELKRFTDQVMADSWRRQVENARRSIAGQAALPPIDAGNTILSRSAEWLQTLPEPTRARLEGIAQGPSIRLAVERGYGADAASDFMDALGDDWRDRMRSPEPEQHWSDPGGGPLIAELAILPPPPTERELRHAARIAGLDEGQVDLFVADSQERWTALVASQRAPLAEEQKLLEQLGRSRQRAEALSLARRYHETGMVAPLLRWRAQMDATIDDLAVRSEALADGAAGASGPEGDSGAQVSMSPRERTRRWWLATMSPAPQSDMQRHVLSRFVGPVLREADLRVARMHPEVPTPEWDAMLLQRGDGLHASALVLLDARVAAIRGFLDAMAEVEAGQNDGNGQADDLRKAAAQRMVEALGPAETMAARAQLDALEALCAGLPAREALRLRAGAARMCWPELEVGTGSATGPLRRARQIEARLAQAGQVQRAEAVSMAIDSACVSLWDALRNLPRLETPAYEPDASGFDDLVRRHGSMMAALDALEDAAMRQLRDAALSGALPMQSLAGESLIPVPVPATQPSS